MLFLSILTTMGLEFCMFCAFTSGGFLNRSRFAFIHFLFTKWIDKVKKNLCKNTIWRWYCFSETQNTLWYFVCRSLFDAYYPNIDFTTDSKVTDSKFHYFAVIHFNFFNYLVTVELIRKMVLETNKDVTNILAKKIYLIILFGNVI